MSTGIAETVPDARVDAAPGATHRPLSMGQEVDLRGPRRLLMLAAIGGLVAAVIAMMGTALLAPVSFRASTAVFTIEGQARNRSIEFSDRRAQSVASLARSESYAAEIKALSGVPVPVSDITSGLSATRPRFGGVVQITFGSDDERLAQRIAPVMLRALATTVERVRSGAVAGSGQIGDLSAQVFVDVPNRPLYYEPFEETTTVERVKPPLTANGLVGGAFGVMLAPLLVLYAHRRTRVDSSDGLAEVVSAPGLLHAPNPTPLGSRGDARRYRSLSEQVLGDCPPDARIVSVAGDGLAGSRRRLAAALAIGLVEAGVGPLTLVDLDERWFSRRWRGLTGKELRRRRRLRRGIRPWRLPLSMWSTWWSHRSAVSTVLDPIGPRRDGVDVVERISVAAARWFIVVVLPDTPGAWPTDEVIGSSDVVLQVVLDGWSLAERVSLCRQLVETAAPGRGRVVVLEN